MSVIETVQAHEILDSRGRPTVKCRVNLEGGATAAASVPCGASTGSAEALELRDNDLTRYRGLGCRKAVNNVNTIIATQLTGKTINSQAELDRKLLELDGTDNKSKLGANAILAVSLAFCRAVSAERGIPLHAHIADLLREQVGLISPRRLPRPTINLFSGGKHAGGQLAIQDILIVPRAQTIDDCMAMAWAVFQSAAELTGERFAVRALRADEGGLAPPFTSIEQAFETAVESIERAGLQPGKDVALAVDIASSHFYTADESGSPRYFVDGPAQPGLSSKDMAQRINDWINAYPIVSIEDGLAEEDWANWPLLTQSLGNRALVLGDDLLCTNPQRVQKAASLNAANALLLKVNQIGSLTEAIGALAAARTAQNTTWSVTVSARSGETEDDWLADLAVGLGGEQIKVGSVTQSERLAKYNRLLEIEKETAWPVTPWPNGT